MNQLIIRLLILDAIVVIGCIVGVFLGIMPISIAALIGWSVIIPINTRGLQKYIRNSNVDPKVADSARAWLSATILLTILAIAAIVNMSSSPPLPLGNIVCSIILIGYIWFVFKLVARLRKGFD